MRFLVAPDSFKGTFSAPEVARLIANGLTDAVQCPLADGGEGTAPILADALGAAPVLVTVKNPWGLPIAAEFYLADEVAVVELAAASGLHHGPGDPILASTYGTGQLIAAAVSHGAHEVLVAAGGSATTDGGFGAIEAIESAGGMRGARLTVLCDVTTPYEQAAAVFGPQKGASPAQVIELTARLHERAAVLPVDPRGVPRTGAAGGFSGGLWSRYGAALVSGAERVLDEVGFDDLLNDIDAVIVGEGRLDGQTGEGKIIDAVVRRVGGRVPVWAVVGSVDKDLGGYDENFAGIVVASTAQQLRDAGAQIEVSV